MPTTHTSQSPVTLDVAPAPLYRLLDPDLLSTREGLMDFVHHEPKPPDLADCAPSGTKLPDTDVRMMYHGNLPCVSTPDVTRGLLDARRTLRTNRFRRVGKRMSMVIDGCAGKSTLLAQIARAYQGLLENERRPDREWTPVVYINVPPRHECNLDWSLPFADFFGMDHTLNLDKRTYRSTDMTEPVIHTMRESGTSLICIDGIDRIHSNDLTKAFAYFDSLQARLRASVIYCGNGAVDIVEEALRHRRHGERPDQSEQFRTTLPVMRIRRIPFHEGQQDAWRTVLMDYDKNLRLYNHVPGAGKLLDFDTELHARTGGYMDTLDQLLCQTAQQSIEDGTEAITQEGLDDMVVGRGDLEDDWA
ncbi:ATP-binding protein [Streptomyces cathayae]|uniref:ATP-binding protein n=1 Tax=Streptomyces cathayae TaxID=3031124 RepID=A0ABY8KAM7_9ACTN|nr:ATP-binding protein [Streptomyces sp. HUAS 5]WGD38716.1 ATP-binding protein [Streptomyces sp. HUAS 5]WGD44731.1 ATP-binding protein [Streptomyces sp. HUAS 5]WGD45226.1 ATP-binding protein [Streptomyces sp. HUAS 5]